MIKVKERLKPAIDAVHSLSETGEVVRMYHRKAHLSSGIAKILDAQRIRADRGLQLLAAPTFLAGVSATVLQYSPADTNSLVANATYAIWLMSLALKFAVVSALLYMVAASIFELPGLRFVPNF